MCGIIGGCGKYSESGLNRALALLQHRGPDGTGIEKVHNGVIGHTRLAIVDVSMGRQPIWNEDHTICAAVNGEFYDQSKVRAELHDHTFKTNSDSEILIHMYEEYGTTAIENLNGEFAFILFDAVKKRWFIGRDRFGIRPLFYISDATGVWAGSKASAVLAIANKSTSICEESLAFAFCNQYLPLDRSWFKNVKKLKPGHYLIYESNKLSTHKYWELPRESATETASNEEARELLRQAVQRRIPTEVEAATHLSGGLDSSIISVLASKEGVRKAYTVKFTDKDTYDESEEAQRTASILGMELIPVPVSQDTIYANWRKAVLAGEDTFINGHGVAKYLLSKQIHADGIKVVLTGEGSDELFYGYAHLVQDYYQEPYTEHSIAGIHTPMGMRQPNVPTWMQAKYELFKPLRDIFGTSEAKKIKSKAGVEEAARTWMQYSMGGYILQVLDDGMGMSHAVESRLPFLDVKFVDWVKTHIRLDSHFARGVEKPWIRQLYKGILPEEVIARKKHPFMAPPTNVLLAGKYGPEIREQILDNMLPQQNKTKTEEWINQLTSDAKSGRIKPSDEPAFSTLLSLAYLQ